MAAWRRAIELSLGDADVERLRSIAQSRTEPASRVERARILLAYREDPSFFAVGQALGLHHQTVQRCVERAVVEGPMAALDDRPRPGVTGGAFPRKVGGENRTVTVGRRLWWPRMAGLQPLSTRAFGPRLRRLTALTALATRPLIATKRPTASAANPSANAMPKNLAPPTLRGS